ncbi:hypothetical protein GGQ64_002602 [Rhizobium azooxidifex]|uniref:Uncharacterized protein n=1 Tax=Mycoplana azooxidifex TaxID=1636188 RepID=A0A7W6D9Z5_9HYPH|nr:hypothetical protein [Mycoplana azooxidifex]MBB3977396.1 hypothetical protein [Mycoplana azooxidifex]
MLTALIAEYKAADAAFRKACDLSLLDAETDPLYDAKEAAELDVLRAPCLTLDDVQAKTRLALADESIFDSLTNCTTNGGEHVLTIFLCSLLGEAVDNIVNSGENQ